MTENKAIPKIMKIFNEEYPGKFILSEGRKKMWNFMLKDFCEENLMATAFHLVSTRKDWPPDIATVRECATNLQRGQLSRKTGADAWENIRRRMADNPGTENPTELSELEKKALKQTTSLYELRRSQNISTDRAHFIKAFEQLSERQEADELVLPSVKQLVSKNNEKQMSEKQIAENKKFTQGLIDGLTGKV